MNNQVEYIFAEELNKESLNVWSFIDGSWHSKNLTLEALNMHKLVVILSVKKCSIFQFELPKLSHRDIPKVIVSLLEDQLFQDFSELWWYYEKVDEKYQVYVWDKKYIDDIKNFAKNKQLDVQGYSFDWLALKDKEVWLNHDGAYVYADDIKGFLPSSLLSPWLKKHFLHYSFLTQAPREDVPNAIETKVSWEQWVLERLREKPFHDIFAKPKKWDINQYFSKSKLLFFTKNLLLALSGLMLVVSFCLLGYQSVLIYQNKQQMKRFADAADSHLEQKLKVYQHQQFEKNKFWFLWIGLQKSLSSSIEIKSIIYEKNKMKIAILVSNINELQELKNKLIKRHIRVEQSQVQTSTNGVRAVLELQGGGYV